MTSINKLAKLAIDAHGGDDRWSRYTTLSVHAVNGGVLWGLKGKDGVINDVTIAVDLRDERVSHFPFGSAARRTRFEPHRVALENADGELLEELLDPRSSFKGHTLETRWTDLQLAYFAGTAMWTYLNTPFLLSRPGVESEEMEPWKEAGETWRRLKVRFPTTIATHSTDQTLYFDKVGMLKRHDYDVEIGGNSPAAHYVSEPKEFSGIIFPTRRRVFPRQADGKAMPEPLIVSIDLDDFVLR